MRFLATIVGGAVLLFLVYLVVGLFADGYFGGDIVPDGAVPEAWAAPDSWSEWRDIVIVLIGFFWVVAGIVLVALLVALLMLVLALRRVVKDNAAPALDSLRASLDNIRGTTEFAGETVASPLIKAYSVYKGVRSGIGAITGLPGNILRRKDKDKKKGKRR